MRRGVLLAGVWAVGVVIAVSLAFAAVARVASGVAPKDVAHLSQTDIDDELTGGTNPRAHTSSTRKSGTTTTSGSTRTTATSTPRSTATTTTPMTSGSVFTTPTVTTPTTSKPVTFGTTTTVANPPPVTPHNTVTTSQGGTLYTRCSGPDRIEYVAAVPKTGYERTVDIEGPGGIRQTFDNGQHRSDIEAECSTSVVHAHVEEETEDD